MWSDMLPELLGEILQRLDLVDSLSFGAVCKSWRRVFASERRRHRKPWLMLPGDTNNTAKMFSLVDRTVEPIRFRHPMIRRRTCIGSSHGWLVTVDEKCSLHLVNAFTGVQVRLPPITSFPDVTAVPKSKSGRRKAMFRIETRLLFIDGNGMRSEMRSRRRMRMYFFQKAVVAPAPRPDSYTVVLLCESGMAVAMAGDETWTLLPRYGVAPSDVIFHKGQLYAVCRDGELYTHDPVVDVDGESTTFASRRVAPRVRSNHDCKYLAESTAGELMLVLRSREEIDGPPFYKTDGFRVRVFDESKRKWSSVDSDIGEAALFVGQNYSTCLPTENYPGVRANSVYFTDDYYELPTMFWTCPRDLGVFDLKDRKLKPIESLPPHLNWPPPIWILPSLSPPSLSTFF